MLGRDFCRPLSGVDPGPCPIVLGILVCDLMPYGAIRPSTLSSAVTGQVTGTEDVGTIMSAVYLP